MDELPDNAECWLDSNRGVYIPQTFAEDFLLDCDGRLYKHVKGVSFNDLKILCAGPDTEWYWETWESVLNNVVLVDDKGVEWGIIHSEDLFGYPQIPLKEQ